MIRYFAIAALIVITIVVLVTGWNARELIQIRIASVVLPASPRPVAPDDELRRRSATPFSGDAPWALSALPECLAQIEHVTGTNAYVRSKLPARRFAIGPPATLRYGDCTISLVGDEANVRRGPDRFRIPPVVRFYRTDDRLVVLRRAHGITDLRIYQRSSISSQ